MTAVAPRTLSDLDGVGRTAVGMALGGGPIAWLVHLVASVALVPYACDTGREWPIHAVTVATLLATLAGLAAARRIRRAGDDDGAEAGLLAATQRARFVGTVGLVLGWLFLALIVLEGLPVLFLDACT